MLRKLLPFLLVVTAAPPTQAALLPAAGQVMLSKAAAAFLATKLGTPAAANGVMETPAAANGGTGTPAVDPGTSNPPAEEKKEPGEKSWERMMKFNKEAAELINLWAPTPLPSIKDIAEAAEAVMKILGDPPAAKPMVPWPELVQPNAPTRRLTESPTVPVTAVPAPAAPTAPAVKPSERMHAPSKLPPPQLPPDMK